MSVVYSVDTVYGLFGQSNMHSTQTSQDRNERTITRIEKEGLTERAIILHCRKEIGDF